MTQDRAQKGLDTDQGIAGLEQALGDRQQAIGDREQESLDQEQAQLDHDIDTGATDNADKADQDRRQVEAGLAQTRRAASQDILDDAQRARDEHQTLLDDQQADLDDPQALRVVDPATAERVRLSRCSRALTLSKRVLTTALNEPQRRGPAPKLRSSAQARRLSIAGSGPPGFRVSPPRQTGCGG